MLCRGMEVQGNTWNSKGRAWICIDTHGRAEAEQAGEWQRQGIVFRDIDSEATVLHSIECLHSEGEV